MDFGGGVRGEEHKASAICWDLGVGELELDPDHGFEESANSVCKIISVGMKLERAREKSRRSSNGCSTARLLFVRKKAGAVGLMV